MAATDVEVSFSVGDSFSTYDELESKVKAYERVHFVQFWKRDVRTIDAAKKRMDRYLTIRFTPVINML